MRWLLAVFVQISLFACLAHGAVPTVFLKNGSSEKGSSVWLENNRLYLSKAGMIYEYEPDDVKFDETLQHNKLGTYQVVATTESPAVASKPVSQKHRTETKIRQTKKPAITVAATVTRATTPPKPQAAAPALPAVPVAETSAASAVPPPPSSAEENKTAENSPTTDKAELERRKQEAIKMMAEAVSNKDPELMKKAIELQKSSMPQPDAPPVRQAGILRSLPLMLLVACILILIGQWVVFQKAGRAGWECLIPFYNMYVLMEISGKPGWWMFLLLVPLLSVVFLLLALLSLASKFGRSALFGLGLLFFPMVFFPLLAFGGSKYEG